MNERSIFAVALDIADPADRAAYLERACAGDAGLRRHVEELLAAQSGLGSFLNRPAAGPDRTGAYEPIAEGPGSRVGPYKLLQEIGEGGMGTVFMAEQEEPVRRMVAVKIIRAGMDSKGVLARFEAERQALALMDHPNIARVLDAGTTAGSSPYFVMELVKGVPITKFCDENQFSLRERLELFIPVCQAIQHAHMKGIIHRDVKPSNVLVAMYDDKPVPKVIDFGVAKATSQKLTDKTLFTAFGAVVGTLEYMSPEQAKLNQLDIDTRSDVYALGVLLYELLTGSTPLDRARLKSAALDEVLRLIREEEPPKPSTRLSTAATLPQIAAARGSAAAQLGKVVRGELDWIVMKALEKDRTRRYETANGFAADVQRYLTGEQVQAVPPSLGYRLRKAYRRNRTAVLVGAAFALLVTGSAGLAVGLAIQARQSEHFARENETAARAAQADAVSERDDKDKALAAEVQARQDETRAKENLQAAVAAERQATYDLTIPLVQKAMQENDLPRAAALLASCPAELRNWEWHFLNRQFDRGSVTLRPGYSNGTSRGTYRFTADGTRAVWLNGTTLKSWDAATGRSSPAIDLAGEGPAKLGDVAMTSPDGGRIALWHKPRYRTEAIRGTDGKVVSKVLDAPELVPNTSITLVMADTGKPLTTLAGSPDPVRALLFSRDGTRIATAGAGNEVRVWDAASGKLLQKLACDGFKQAVPVAFTPDGSAVVTNTADKLYVDGVTPKGDGEFRVWDLETGKVRVTGPIREYKDGPSSAPGGQSYPMQDTPLARISPNGRFAMGLDTDRFKTLTDLTTGKAAFTLPGDFHGIGFRTDGAVLAVNRQGVCATFELPGGTTLASYTLSSVHSFRQGAGLTRTMDLSADGQWLTIYYQASGTVEVREAESGAVVRTVFVERNGFFVRGSHGVVDRAGKRLLTTALNGEMKVWDLTVRTPADTVKLRTESTWSPMPLSSSSDGRTVAVLGSRPDPGNPKSTVRLNELELVDVATGGSRICQDTLGNFTTGRHTHAAFSRDGRSVAAVAVAYDTTPVSSAERRVVCSPMVWDAATGELTRRGEPIRADLSSVLDDAHIPQVGFARDGPPVVAAVAADDPPAKRVWRVHEIAPDGKFGQVRATIPAGTRSCLRLSADGRYAVRFGRSADVSGMLVWDLVADRSVWEIPAVPGLSGELDGAFSADGTRLVVTDAPAGASAGNGRPDVKRTTVGVFLSDSGRAVSTFTAPAMSTRAGFNVSPDGRRVFWFPLNTGTSVVVNADTGRELLANFAAGEGLSQFMNPRGLMTPDGRLVTGRTPTDRTRILTKECSLRIWDGRPAERVWAPAPSTDELLARSIRLCEAPDPAVRNPAAALRIATEAIEWYPNEYGCRLALGLALFRNGRPADAETVLTACVIHEEESERTTRLPPGAPVPANLRRATAYHLLALVTAANGQPERARVWFAWGDTRLASPLTQGNRAFTALRSIDADAERGQADPFRREAARVLGLTGEPVALVDIVKMNADPAVAANRMLDVGAMVKRKEYATALWAAEFLLAHGDPHPTIAYNAACVYSLAAGGQSEKKAEYGARAVALLREAMKLGYGDVAHTEADTDFDPVRDRDDFRKVLAEMREKFPPKPTPMKPTDSK